MLGAAGVSMRATAKRPVALPRAVKRLSIGSDRARYNARRPRQPPAKGVRLFARIARILGSGTGRAVALGAASGLVLLAFALIMRGRAQETVTLNVQTAEDPNIVRVYVGGEVAQPGLFRLTRGSRVADAIAAAGGVTTAGDTSAIGMAAPLEDADQVIVPARSAAATGASATPARSTLAAPGQVVVNLNTASAADLELLPGIGPALATRIVEYRTQQGPFQTIDELAEIQGISERMVDELRPLVAVGP